MTADWAEPFTAGECLELVRSAASPLTPRGLGRSYGDSALGERVLCARRLDRFVDFDPATGLLTCEAGVSLDQIARLTVPRGWFLAVTPGTRYVTVGGAIAADVHGKNHHLDGTFSQHVLEVVLALGNGERVRASRSENPDLFRAVCGGMGLVAMVLTVRLQLRRVASSIIEQKTIKLPSLQALTDAFEAQRDSPYSVAWVDCMSRSGRSLLMLGRHAGEGGRDWRSREPLPVPFDMPEALLNRATARLFNALYYARVSARGNESSVPIDSYFYPLDALGAWNRLYGRSGFVQYQFVVPKAAAASVLPQVLTQIAEAGVGAYLAVLKLFGPANDNLLSFPMEGYTLAVDFRADARALGLMDRLDAMVLHAGGRIYLAKDARMAAQTFRQGYPHWAEFEETRARWHAHGRFSSAQSRRLGLR